MAAIHEMLCVPSTKPLVGSAESIFMLDSEEKSQLLHPLRIPGILNLDPALADEIGELPNHVMASLLGEISRVADSDNG